MLHETRARHPCTVPADVLVRQGPTGSASLHRNRQPTLLVSFTPIHDLRTEFPGRVEVNGDAVPHRPHLDRSFLLRARRSIEGVGGNVPDIAESIAEQVKPHGAYGAWHQQILRLRAEPLRVARVT